MKVLKFLSIPVMALGALVMATATASAHHAEIKAELNCASTSSTQVCYVLTITTGDIPAGEDRDVTLTLGQGTANAFGQIGDGTCTLGQGAPTGVELDTSKPCMLDLPSNLDSQTVNICFPNVATAGVNAFTLRVAAIEETGEDLTVNGEHQVDLSLNNCPTPPPAQQPPPAASPSPSAATAATLAQTGGLDFRFPLVGLIVLVAGAALFVVSAARGRPASK